MLLPALSKAREKARAISCTNNLKQVQLGNLLYGNDYDDYLPMIGYRENDGIWGGVKNTASSVDVYVWFTVNPLVVDAPMKYAEWQSRDPAAEVPFGSKADKSAWHKVLMCPSCPTGDRICGNIGYYANLGMGYSKEYHESTWLTSKEACTWHRISSIRLPSLHVNIFDGANHNNGDTWLIRSGFYGLGISQFYTKGQVEVFQRYFRHADAMNLSFTDGHVEAVNAAKGKTRNPDATGGTYSYLATDYYWWPGYKGPGGDE